MKFNPYIYFLTIFLGSCTAFKKITPSDADNQSVSIDYPRLHPGDVRPSPSGIRVKPVSNESVAPVELVSPWLFKYAILLNVPVEELNNLKLYSFIHEWYGTPYKYGGTTKAGIDCSAFTLFLYEQVYNVKLPRTSRDQYTHLKKISRAELQEGDLVFFKERTRITHVGVYLGNNKFAHASTSQGVMISDLDQLYFSRRYAGAGRLPVKQGAVAAQ